jgi:hypothetical protein
MSVLFSVHMPVTSSIHCQPTQKSSNNYLECKRAVSSPVHTACQGGGQSNRSAKLIFVCLAPLAVTLRNIHNLLAPGGFLLMLEMTASVRTHALMQHLRMPTTPVCCSPLYFSTLPLLRKHRRLLHWLHCPCTQRGCCHDACLHACMHACSFACRAQTPTNMLVCMHGPCLLPHACMAVLAAADADQHA